MCKHIHKKNQVKLSFQVYNKKVHVTCNTYIIYMENICPTNIFIPMFRKKTYILQEIEAGLKMYALLAICTLLGGLQGITASIDTSNYKILIDRRADNFTYWEAQCRGEPK